MVFAVAASMLVGTPLTASAAGIRGVYSVSDGTNDDIRGENDNSHTGTVSNTNTSSHSGVLKDNDARIIGIVLDKNYVNAEVGAAKKETLKATVIIEDDNLTVEQKEEIGKELGKKIVWEVQNYDGSTVGANKKLSIKVSAADRTEAELNPREGTAKGEEMIVSAKIDGSWYVKRDENGNAVTDGNGYVLEKETFADGKFYEAKADVYIKQYSESLELINMPQVDGKNVAYAKHTMNLNTDEHLKRVPEAANDDITWISTNTKAAKITAAGVVTFGTAGQSGKIIAVSEKGKQDEYEFTVDPGTPASKVVILDDDKSPVEPFDRNTTTVDLASIYNSKITSDWDDDTRDVTVQMYAKVKAAVDTNGNIVTNETDAASSGGKYKFKNMDLEDGVSYLEVSKDSKTVEPKTVHVTDVIAWSSNKTAFADVEADYTDSDDATLTAKGVGTATITAKASGGKKATLKVVVKATLCDLEITNKEDELYSGQSLQMTYDKKPEESKDAVAWSIAKVKNAAGKDVKNPNATINAKGVLTIKPKLDPTCNEVTVVLQSKKKLPNGEKDENGKDVTEYVHDEKTIYLTQSSIDGIEVREGSKLIAEVHTEYNNGKASVKTNTRLANKKTDNVTTINVPKDKVYDVSVIESALDYKGGTETLTWKTSNASIADFVNYGDTVKIEAKKKGTVTMTVSGIRAEDKDGKLNKASVIKTTFKVNVLQPVNAVTLNKPSVVLNQKDKNNVAQKQTVSFKATLGPTGVDKKTVVGWDVDTSKATTRATIDTKGKLTMDAPVVGDVFVVTAKVPSGAYATSTVTIVSKTTGVAIAEAELVEGKEPVLFNDPKANTRTATIGETFKMYPCINIGGKNDANWKAAGATATGDVREDVTYSVNKKGIVNIDSDGTVHVINSGTVTITAKTPLNKKATLKVTVAKP